MSDVDERLNALRGATPRKPHNARTLAAFAANPGCRRRTLLDAAGIDKGQIAEGLGVPISIGQMSSIAIARGKGFEAKVKADGCAELLRLLREHIGLPVAEVHYHDLNPADTDDRITSRLRRSQRALQASAKSNQPIGTLFDHPILQLTVNGVQVRIEPDLIAFKLGNQFFIVEIKSFPILDGTADSGKVAAAAQQSAVYVRAMREMLETARLDPDMVSDQVVLVCPKDFSNHPVAELLDVRKQLATLKRQLDRMESVESLLRLLPPDLSFDVRLDTAGRPTRDPQELEAAVFQVTARYSPECLGACELGGVCRAEVSGMVPVLGRVVREDLGGIDSIKEAVELATGLREPDAGQQQVADLLRRAYGMREAALGAVR
ncbi:hypothetical protein [Dactylosporangium matsuzakiense]|uniref:Secreted protein n=1 Tax=Dactylosporangium matsuzakiense TaxID=53360 RepID=A0A9W6KQM6_9ACTN|nr:hypothetical protein [Dactylosporangium matsuzakiense]UWZ44593.1 hypothetical protein Dmats_45860 [Dactylosporangium matsuzakiense]GLL05355.1 hypothetical protein GCM10017581_071020 [Dactylosporangium matsuzakiense]